MSAFDPSVTHWEVPLGPPGRQARLALPRDLSGADVQTLVDFLLSLPSRPANEVEE